MTKPEQERASGLSIEQIFVTAENQVRRLITAHPGQIPMYTEGGRWHFGQDSWAQVWTGGFLAGMMWVFAERTGDPFWRDQAERYTRSIDPRRLESGIHDIGFLFSPSWGRWHDLDPSEETSDALIRGGRIMASYFNPGGRYLRTWVDKGSTFVDVMMEVDVIYRAASLAGDPELAEIATAHALTARRYLVRGDASTVHEGWFDPDTGEFLRTATHQGFRSDSSWVRGLTWAIYGFGTAFQWTHDSRFLDTARRCADFYMDKVGTDFVCPNDWADPSPEFPYEASAASIAASGMLQLAELLGADGRAYMDYARHIVARLSEPDFLETGVDGRDGVIKHAIYHRRHNLGVDESVMWGDYYFVEALHRLSKGGSQLPQLA